SMSEWNQLTDEQKKVVLDGARMASDINRALAPVRDQQALEFLRQKGMNITEVDTTGFRQKAIPLQDKIAADIGATALLAEIRDALHQQDRRSPDRAAVHGHSHSRDTAGVQPVRAEHIAELERGIPEVRLHLAGVHLDTGCL